MSSRSVPRDPPRRHRSPPIDYRVWLSMPPPLQRHQGQYNNKVLFGSSRASLIIVTPVFSGHYVTARYYEMDVIICRQYIFLFWILNSVDNRTFVMIQYLLNREGVKKILFRGRDGGREVWSPVRYKSRHFKAKFQQNIQHDLIFLY